jgi:hypothetical protein
MFDGYRRDLELAPGAGFRLRRRLSARIFSALLALAAVAWGGFDVWSGHEFVGAATIALAAAFTGQLVLAELESWRFEGALVHRALRGFRFHEERLDPRRIRGVQVNFVQGRARASVVLSGGEELPLVEGPKHEVQRIADRLSLLVAARPEVLH